MPLFSRRKREGRVNEGLLNELGRELEERCSTTDGTNHLFIHPDDASDVLRRERVKDLLGSLSWYQEDDRTFLWQNMRLIICILISMRWGDWEQFQAYFFYPESGFERPRYTDKSLPIPKVNSLGHVPASFSRRFLSHQYTFVPVFIEENSHLKYSTDYRLPILKVVPLPDAEGAQGVVEQVHIERRFLYYVNQTFNHSPQVMACKRITTKTAAGKLNFDAEQRTLKQFKSCVTDNKNIMQSFASFIHGTDFIILSPWANGRDLNLFLTKPDEILDYDYMSRSIRFTPDNLLTEAYNLARALNFLHCEMVTTRGKKLRCAHLDLKPENVLVSFLPEDRMNDTPVGRWKISDFGLSQVEEAVTEDRVLPIGRDEQEASRAPGNIARELSFQPPTRGPGAFQPPEVQSAETAKVSTRRDVWSYGCILAMVLAFALGGSAEVENQSRRRIIGGDDYFYRRTNRRSRTPGPSPETTAHKVDAELKPHLRKWLEQASRLADERHGQWIQYTSNLILKLLEVDVISRPEILLAVETLDAITTHTERVATHRLWGFDDGSRLTEPIIVPPRETTPGAGASTTPFVGVKEYSPPSSASNTARQRSPRLGSQRSSVVSSSIFFQVDPSLSFATLDAPDRCQDQGATIEPSGHAAALWSPTDVRLYALSLKNDPAMWSERPTSTYVELEPFSVASLPLPEKSKCLKVQLAGQWIALLEQMAPSAFCIRLHRFINPQQSNHEFRSSFSCSQLPEDFKVSTQGVLAIRSRNRVVLHAHGGSATVSIDKEFGAMAFSVNGQFFCLWERDRREKGHTKPAWNYWSVWSQGSNPASPGFTMLGKTISFQLPPWSAEGASGEVLLISYTSYPRFIACDRQQYVYLVRADAQDARAHLVGRTDNAKAGFILPDDENFMLIRGSQHDSQRAEKCFMSFMGSPSLQNKSCGKLYENIDVKTDGVAVVPFDQHGGSPCLLTLRPSGRLVRKVL